jgi:hypothetical protein
MSALLASISLGLLGAVCCWMSFFIGFARGRTSAYAKCLALESGRWDVIELMLPPINLADAEHLCKETQYADEAVEYPETRINWADAGAFFFEGYNHARNIFQISQHVGDPHRKGARSRWRGHDIYFDGEAWRFCDNNDPLPGWGGPFRPCANCSEMMNDHEADHCLGALPGVDNACCGHGMREDSYVRFTNGVVLKGFYIDHIRDIKRDREAT